MKELSIEEKAKAYDEAIERAKNTIEVNQTIPDIVECVESLFPELKEGEGKDEKIRKALIRAFKSLNTIKVWNGIERTDIIDWLEKQGNLMKALQISNAKIGELIEKNYYLKEQLEKQGQNNMGISEATKKKLEDNLNKALEKETPESWNKFLDEQGSKEENLKEHNICDTCEDSNGCLIPCCAKLLEKQGEQKMITPEESLGIDSDTYNKIVDECVYGEQKLTDKIESRQEELTEFEKAVKQVMEEAIECGDTHNLKADADMLLRLVQNHSWSKEDERIYKSIIYSFAHNYPLTVQQQEFVKSLRDRIQPTKDWSEEDEKILNLIIARLHSHPNVEVEEYGKDYHWLKSLKHQSTWKPSDEQMDALHYVTNFDYGGHKATLVSLYEQLKKLMGE